MLARASAKRIKRCQVVFNARTLGLGPSRQRREGGERGWVVRVTGGYASLAPVYILSPRRGEFFNCKPQTFSR